MSDITTAIDALQNLADGTIGLRGIHRTRTFPIAISALEKQLPKTPIVRDDEAFCPSCDSAFATIRFLKKICAERPYCQYCGQRLDYTNMPKEPQNG